MEVQFLSNCFRIGDSISIGEVIKMVSLTNNPVAILADLRRYIR